MLIKVFHGEVQVAEVIAPAAHGIEHALEFAWAKTQNIEGSWSRGRHCEWGVNGDYHPEVKVLVPLHEVDGKTYGLRSSMVGDIFEACWKKYEVASCGFRELKGETA
jgi:hypothetical protein